MHWTNSKCLASPFDWEKRTADNESIYIVNLCAVDFISRDGPRPSRWWIAAFPAARTADASPRDNKFEFFIANRPFKSVKKLASQRATVHCAVLLQEENNNNIREEKNKRETSGWLTKRNVIYLPLADAQADARFPIDNGRRRAGNNEASSLSRLPRPSRSIIDCPLSYAPPLRIHVANRRCDRPINNLLLCK